MPCNILFVLCTVLICQPAARDVLSNQFRPVRRPFLFGKEVFRNQKSKFSTEIMDKDDIYWDNKYQKRVPFLTEENAITKHAITKEMQRFQLQAFEVKPASELLLKLYLLTTVNFRLYIISLCYSVRTSPS